MISPVTCKMSRNTRYRKLSSLFKGISLTNDRFGIYIMGMKGKASDTIINKAS